MPELPEVETVRRGLAPHVTGRRLDDVVLRRDDLRWPIPTAAVRALTGRTCGAPTRRSKYLILPFDGPGSPRALIHLGMSGRLFLDVLPRASSAQPEWETHEHWRMRFGKRLARYVDPRRFGMLDVAESQQAFDEHPLLTTLGPEPLSDAFDADHLFRRSRGRKVATKVFVMDAKNVVGVGNIYASEACFRAGVRPGRAASRLTRPDCEHLVEAIREVLTEAIDAGGTTLRDYIGVDQGAGYFQRALFVYGRVGEPCKVCGTPIAHRVLGQRATYWCPLCQPR